MKYFLIFLLFCFPISVFSQIPPEFTWQGLITDIDGNNLNGNYSISVSLFSSDNQTDDIIPLWTEDQMIDIHNGIANIVLGANPLNSIATHLGGGAWLEIKIGNEIPLKRMKIHSSPRSIIAKTVENNSISSNNIVDGSILTEDIADDAITETKLAENSVGQFHLKDNSIVTEHIKNFEITTGKIDFNAVTSNRIANNTVVRSIGKNLQLTEDVKLVEGINIKIEENTPNNNDIRITCLDGLKFVHNPDNTVSVFIVDEQSLSFIEVMKILPNGETEFLKTSNHEEIKIEYYVSSLDMNYLTILNRNNLAIIHKSDDYLKSSLLETSSLNLYSSSGSGQGVTRKTDLTSEKLSIEESIDAYFHFTDITPKSILFSSEDGTSSLAFSELSNNKLVIIDSGYANEWFQNKFIELTPQSIKLNTVLGTELYPLSIMENGSEIFYLDGENVLHGNELDFTTGEFDGVYANLVYVQNHESDFLKVYGRTDLYDLVFCHDILQTQYFQVDGSAGFGDGISCYGNVAVDGTVYADAFLEYSDISLKKDFVKLENISYKLNEINPYYYFLKTDENSENKQIGFIAQEVEKVFPELVETKEDNLKTVNYSRFTAILLSAFKEQQNEIDKLKNELKESKTEIKQLKSKLNNYDTLENEVKLIKSILKDNNSHDLKQAINND